jgi:hypothetical protein
VWACSNFGGNFNPNFNGGNNRGNQGTEVIERGGAGAWHGTTQGLFKDDALNARNVFAANKPPYQERQVNVEVGGPAVPGRLTTNMIVQYSLAQNVDTINATLPEGPFAFGITRPTTNRSIESRNTQQLAVHYNNPSSVMSSDNFGKYTSASDSREVEVGLRFQF